MTAPDHICRIFRSLSNRSRLAILLALAQGPHTIRQLGQRLALAQPTTHGHVAQLQTLGLIQESVRQPRGRATLFELTAQAVAMEEHLTWIMDLLKAQ